MLGNQKQAGETDRAEKVIREWAEDGVGFSLLSVGSVSSKGDRRAEYCRHTDAARTRKSAWLC